MKILIRKTFFFTIFLLVYCLQYAAAATFDFKDKCLVVKTASMEMVIESGAVHSVRDVKSGEVFSGGFSRDALLAVPSGFSGLNDWQSFMGTWASAPERYTRHKEFSQARKRPGPDSEVSFKNKGPYEAELTYTGLLNGQEGDSLVYNVRVDNATGEILLDARAFAADEKSAPFSLDIPLCSIKTTEVVLGSGASHKRASPRASDCTTRVAAGLYSPNVAVAIGKKSILSVWADATFFDPCNILLAHTPEEDIVILNTIIPYGGVPPDRDAKTLTSPVWRFGVHSTWLDSARRYRAVFERDTGAKPLWENACPWVRNIHSVTTEMASAAEAEGFYGRIASLVDPEKLLLFYWNGGNIIEFGDHRYIKNQRPEAGAVAVFKKLGFRWLGYHPYILLMSPKYTENRLKTLAAQKQLPDNYRFNPDYDGPPEKFYQYFLPYSSDDAGTDKINWALHPGAEQVRNYFINNFANYCAVHNMDGAYLDVMGATYSHRFPPEKKVFEGMNWKAAEVKVGKETRKRHPELGMMSEYQNERTVPHTFYTWAGGGYLKRADSTAGRKVDPLRPHPTGTNLSHPLRTALWGSYTWTREETRDEWDPAAAALIGSLPALDVNCDWRTARVRLFTEEALYNDLPEKWEEGVYAYYRGKGNRWFQFRQLPFGDGYVEQTPSGGRVLMGRFAGQTASPLNEPVSIQHWPAYREKSPVGLNPSNEYFFTRSEGKQEHFVISGMPEGVFIKRFRHTDNYSVVEFGTVNGNKISGEVTVFFLRKGIAVSDILKDYNGPFEEGSTKSFHTVMPGGLVFVWKQPDTVDGRFSGGIVSEAGSMHGNGIPDALTVYRYRTKTENITVGGRDVPAVRLETGQHTGYAESWANLEDSGTPAVLFIAGFPATEQEKKTLRARRCCLLVNGTELWSETIEPGAGWKDVEVPVSDCKGRKVLVSLVSSETGDGYVFPMAFRQPVYFAGIRIDKNPLSLVPLDGSQLPLPSKILFSDTFDKPEISPDWKVNVSPVQEKQASVTVEDGMLSFTGQHYKYLYLSRKIPQDTENPVLQARVRVVRTGGAGDWNPGIGLLWKDGKHTFFTVGGHRGGDEYFSIRGYGARRIPLGNRMIMITENNYYDLWLRISLKKESIEYASSLDGRVWNPEAVVNRTDAYASAPQVLVIGRGTAGTGEYFSNDGSWASGYSKTYMGDVVIGTE